MIQGQITKIDEFVYVTNVLKLMNSHNPTLTTSLLGTLKENKQKYIYELMHSKRVTVQHKGETTTIARRIVKAKRKTKTLLEAPQNPHTQQ